MIAKKNPGKSVMTYVITTLSLIAFNYIYSLFGHGVTSPFMTYAFAISLVLGVAGFFVIGRLNLYTRAAYNLYNAGIATLIVGSILRGVFDIAGADSVFPMYYFIAGAVLVVIGGLMYAYQWLQNNQMRKCHDC